MARRRLRFGIPVLAILIALGSGCSLMDRNSYSLVFRKQAHQYEPPAPKAVPAPVEEKRIEAKLDPTLPDPRTFVRHDLDLLVEGAEVKLSQESFRPFAYCHLHDSHHEVESALAILVAPVEYPLALTANFTYAAVTTTLEILMAPLKALAGPTDTPVNIQEGKKEPAK